MTAPGQPLYDLAGATGADSRWPRPIAVFLEQWVPKFRIHLHDRRFWIVQGMIVSVAIAHTLGEYFWEGHLGPAYFIPASLYFFPVLYASLYFGREGAIPTALWSGLIAIPNVIESHEGIQRAGESFQLLMMVFVGVVVATRVDKEITARRRAEASEDAFELSERKYRALFQSAGEPILVVDGLGTIQETNAAAASLLAARTGSPVGASIMGLLGIDIRPVLGAAPAGSPCVAPDISLLRPDGTEAWLQPICSSMATEGRPMVQVLLRDVTERRGFQSYAQEIVRAQEEERQRIAHELHDVALQSAVLICRRLDAAAEAAEAGPSEQLQSVLADARSMAESLGDELRRFSRDLRPLILEDLGLVPALRQLVNELGGRAVVHCQLSVSGTERRLDAGAELTLFRVAQEALRNVERHSRASHATVRLVHGPDGATLTVSDNGMGFEVPNLTVLVGGRRLGLLGMQERARLAGGHCEVRSVPGSGTSVTVWVPNELASGSTATDGRPA